MTNEEARAYFIDCNERIISVAKDENIYNYETQQVEDVFMRRTFEANELAIKALDEKDCVGAISRQAAIDVIFSEPLYKSGMKKRNADEVVPAIYRKIKSLPPVNPKEETVTEFADRCRECGKMKRCRDCKYFEYDSVANWDGIPIIVAHEICSRWGDGCKTSEDGYCFLFEPKEDKE